jgi:hypothetical protein
VLGLISDQLYLEGVLKQDLSKFNLALKLFPLDKDILVGPAQLYAAHKTISVEAFKSVNEALKYDPYSPQFLNLQLQYAIIYKDEILANLAFRKLQKIAPSLPIIKELVKRGIR